MANERRPDSLPPDDRRWLESYLPEIASGEITVHESDAPWVDCIKRRFPMGPTGILWENLPQIHVSERNFPHASAERDVEVRGFVRRFGSDAELGQDGICVIIGDMDTSVALETTFDVLLKISPRLAREPQGTYVIARDGEWCLAFTMLGNMYFGKSPVRSKK